jgi:hypothetical protein
MLFRFLNTIYTHIFSIAVLAALVFGWQHRDDNYLSAETGTGYILGIVGGSMMLVLLLYPLSKRVALLNRLIPLRYWFGMHMVLGTLGPVLILFHSNFQPGSANSNIALVSMLLVAISGIIGRYIYTNIHHGLYGARITLRELKQSIEEDYAELHQINKNDEKLNGHMKTMEEKALRPYTGLMKSMADVIYLAVNAPRTGRKVQQLIKLHARENSEAVALAGNKKLACLFRNYALALRRIAAFKVYERLFSLWHILHLPLFFMMIITAIIHIFAVHLY